MAIPFAELNKINPSSVIELYELELTVGLHIPTGNPNNIDTVFRFHAGANLNNFGQVKFNGNSYQRVAVKAEGFENTSTGTIPPKFENVITGLVKTPVLFFSKP